MADKFKNHRSPSYKVERHHFKDMVEHIKNKSNPKPKSPAEMGAILLQQSKNPHVVCFLGAAGSRGQLHEILRDFVPPDNFIWIVASEGEGDVYETVAETVARRDSVVLIRSGSIEPLVEKKVYVVHRHCRVFVSKGTLEVPQIMGMALGKSKKEEAETPWLRHTVQILRGGSRHGIKFVFLSSLEANGIGAQLVRRLHDAGHKFFTPLFTPYHRPGLESSYSHTGGLTELLISNDIPHESCELNKLTQAIVESIPGELAELRDAESRATVLKLNNVPAGLPFLLTREERDVVKYCAEQIKPVEWPRWNFFYRPQFLFESIKDVMGSLEKNYDNPDHRRDFLKDLKKPTSQAYGRLQATWTPAASQFFRDGIDHWRTTMFKHLIRPIIERAIRSKQKINLGVLGCGTGQEVYTLAILILEDLYDRYCFSGSPSDIVRIIGYDIRAEYVDYMLTGRYHRDEHSMQIGEDTFEVGGPYCPEYQWVVDKYFTGPDANGWLRITDEVKSIVTGRQMDVFLPSTEVEVPEFDLLLCRKVFIYLNDLGKQAVLNAWYPHLRRGANFVVSWHEEVPLETELLTIAPGLDLPYAYRLKLKD